MREAPSDGQASEHADEHSHRPGPGDDDPAGVLSLRLVKQDPRDDSVAEKDQQARADHLSKEHLGDHLPMRCGAPDMGARRHIAKAVRIRKSKRDPTVTGPTSSCYVRHRRTIASTGGGGRFDSDRRVDGWCPRVSGATTRRGGVGSPPVGAFVVDADLVRRWIVESAARIGEQRDFLTQLDAAIGDADHGVNMDAWVRRRARHPPVGTGTARRERSCKRWGPRSSIAWVARRARSSERASVRSARRSRRPSDRTARRCCPASVPGSRASRRSAQRLPGTRRWSTRGNPPSPSSSGPCGPVGRSQQAARNAAEAANAGVAATLPMQARKGRASYLGPRSIGHQDPGATSTALHLRRPRAGHASSVMTALSATRRSARHDPVRRPRRADPHGVGQARRVSA